MQCRCCYVYVKIPSFIKFHALIYLLLLNCPRLKMTSEKNAQIAQAQEAFQMMHQISQLLCTGLDTESLAICIRLCELGVDPETLAHVIWEIRRMGENAAQTKPGSYNPMSLKE